MITRHKAFAHVDRLAQWQRGEKPAPVTLEWDLSNRCSLGCQDCHFAHTHVAGPWSSASTRVFPEGYSITGGIADPSLVLRGLQEAHDLGVEGVVWSGGGEPTLHPDWIRITDAAAELGLRQGMYTLGAHVSEDGAHAIATNLSFVIVSLDAADDETYAREKKVVPIRFHEASRGITRMVEAGANVGVSFLLHRKNWYDAKRMRAYARSLEASFVTFRPIIDTSPDNPAEPLDNKWVNEEVLEFLNQFEEDNYSQIDVSRFAEYGLWKHVGRGYDTCHAIKLNATVTPDGRVWICPQRRGVEGSCIGHLGKESFGELWQRHVGEWKDFSQCRVMCRLHLTNTTIAPIFEEYKHKEFV